MPISFQSKSTNISSISLPTSTPIAKSVKQWVGQTFTNIKGRITSTIVSQAAAETQLRPPPPVTPTTPSNKSRAPPPPLTPTTNGLGATQTQKPPPPVTPTTQKPASNKSRAPPPPLTPTAQFEPVTKSVNSSAPASTNTINTTTGTLKKCCQFSYKHVISL